MNAHSLYAEPAQRRCEVSLPLATMKRWDEEFERTPHKAAQAKAKALLAAIRGVIFHGAKEVIARAPDQDVAEMTSINLTGAERPKVRVFHGDTEINQAHAKKHRDVLEHIHAPQRPALPSIEDLIQRQHFKAQGGPELPWNKPMELATAAALKAVEPPPAPAPIVVEATPAPVVPPVPVAAPPKVSSSFFEE